MNGRMEKIREMDIQRQNERADKIRNGEILTGEEKREQLLKDVDEKIAVVTAELETEEDSHVRKRLKNRLTELQSDRKRIESDHTYSVNPWETQK